MKRDTEGNKRYKTREVLLGYLQTMGEDYEKFFSPVTKDYSTRIDFAITLFNHGWVFHSADIEDSFLNPTTSNPMFIEWPQGCLELGLITEKEKIVSYKN